MAEAIETQREAADPIAGFQARMLKTPKEKRNTGWLKTNLSALDEQWREFHQQHLRLPRDAKTKEHSYFTEDVYGTTQNHYIDVKTMILNALQPGRGQSSVEADEEFAEVTFESRQRTKLPTIDLPKFSGNQTEWETFKEMFLSVVHEVPTIPPVMKLQYLLASLTGEAARRLGNTKIKAGNYQGAWETLLNKYDNKRVNISTHLQTISACPPVARKSEIEINRVVSVMLEAKRGLENLECPVQHWDAWLNFHTVQKLDSVTREEWEMQLGEADDMPKFDTLVKFLTKYARALETAHANDGTSKPPNAGASSKPNVKSKNFKTTQAHVASAEPTDKAKRNKIRTCVYCKEQHNVSSCERYRALPIPQRRKFISSNGICENCLKPKHAASECHAPGRCFTCGDKHHTSLHMDESQAANSKSETRKDSPAGTAVAGKHSMPDSVNSCHTNPTSRSEITCQQILLAELRYCCGTHRTAK